VAKNKVLTKRHLCRNSKERNFLSTMFLKETTLLTCVASVICDKW